ncbi:hypothetical protein BDW60DRAFT_176910 [Aspergillus nidulans var. acristatus]
MQRDTVKIKARNADGGREEASLNAAIDDTLEENIIARQWSEHLNLENTPFHSFTTLRDSHDVSYTVDSMVELLLGPADDGWTDVASFYVSSSESGSLSGGFQVLLGKSWKGKFRLPSDSGPELYKAAPSVYHYKGRDDKEKRQAEARKLEEERRKIAKQNDAEFNKRKKDRAAQNGKLVSSVR